ncbi:MAG: DinB family protein, partial [Spirosomaceae bacterium]|nr:DinB family protein [Spirosomataceae bacterium]
MTVNVAKDVLNQLRDVLIQLENSQYAAPLRVFNGASLGKHSRHVIEFFQCLMKSTTENVLNYDARVRYLRLEEDVQYSVEVIDKITEYLSENNFDNIGISLVSEFGNEEQIAVPTNFNRELIYLIEHSIHHFALIRIGVQENFPHVNLSECFGVAYS